MAMKLLITVFLYLGLASPLLAEIDQRPNFLVIMTDDQSHDTLTSEFMPNTTALIADEGLTGTQFIMPTALCCPSRASFLTGKYAHHTGVRTNTDQLVGPTIANRLHEAGYFTGLIGKYLNSWPGDARPEYDYWAAWTKGYTNPKLNLFGTFQTVPGYVTYILRDRALDFLNKVPSDRPFFLLFASRAPHSPATPAPGDEHLHANLPKWRPPSFNPADQPDKPNWLKETPVLNQRKIDKQVDELRLNQLRCLHSVDVAVGDILNKLKLQGKLDNTFIVFFSDNGYFWGEHRLLRKNRVYEEASHGPFAIRYPPLIPESRLDDSLISAIDLAPTICELAGLPIPADVDGRSLVPLLRGSLEWRDAVLLEGWPGTMNEQGPTSEEEEEPEAEQAQIPPSENIARVFQDYEAIRTKQFVYVETVGDKPELYHVSSDPYQMHNLADQHEFADLVKRFSDWLHHEKL
jgi:Arylsulfatase A and related enzymes